MRSADSLADVLSFSAPLYLRLAGFQFLDLRVHIRQGPIDFFHVALVGRGLELLDFGLDLGSFRAAVGLWRLRGLHAATSEAKRRRIPWSNFLSVIVDRRSGTLLPVIPNTLCRNQEFAIGNST